MNNYMEPPEGQGTVCQEHYFREIILSLNVQSDSNRAKPFQCATLHVSFLLIISQTFFFSVYQQSF